MDDISRFLGGTGVAGGKMKETGEAHWKTQPSLLIAVVLFSGENVTMMGRSAALAPTVTVEFFGVNTTSAWFHFLWHINGKCMQVGDDKPFGCSVRSELILFVTLIL
jgi:hypothetical protein